MNSTNKGLYSFKNGKIAYDTLYLETNDNSVYAVSVSKIEEL